MSSAVFDGGHKLFNFFVSDSLWRRFRRFYFKRYIFTAVPFEETFKNIVVSSAGALGKTSVTLKKPVEQFHGRGEISKVITKLPQQASGLNVPFSGLAAGDDIAVLVEGLEVCFAAVFQTASPIASEQGKYKFSERDIV